mmetsp:Transcript_12880/g.37815  ORF Transcript_12880/g.37815 Transcript_12880/m.37815 type:complete len:296 (-) Transcript_12880:92-979(-)
MHRGRRGDRRQRARGHGEVEPHVVDDGEVRRGEDDGQARRGRLQCELAEREGHPQCRALRDVLGGRHDGEEVDELHVVHELAARVDSRVVGRDEVGALADAVAAREEKHRVVFLGEQLQHEARVAVDDAAVGRGDHLEEAHEARRLLGRRELDELAHRVLRDLRADGAVVLEDRVDQAGRRDVVRDERDLRVLEEHRDVRDQLRLHQRRARAHGLEQPVRGAQHTARLDVTLRRLAVHRQVQQLQRVILRVHILEQQLHVGVRAARAALEHHPHVVGLGRRHATRHGRLLLERAR